MKIQKITVLASVAALVLMPVARAATVPGTFNVTVTLTSKCTMAAVSDLAFGTYEAFQGSSKLATPITATLTCTRGISSGITAAFDTSAVGSTAAATATNGVGAGVLAGLQYDITAVPSAVVAGTAATASSIGTGDTRPFTISGTIPAAQAGDASAAATQVRILTITY
jgi:spore coat protein U-like protein